MIRIPTEHAPQQHFESFEIQTCNGTITTAKNRTCSCHILLFSNWNQQHSESTEINLCIRSLTTTRCCQMQMPRFVIFKLGNKYNLVYPFNTSVFIIRKNNSEQSSCPKVVQKLNVWIAKKKHNLQQSHISELENNTLAMKHTNEMPRSCTTAISTKILQS